MTWIAALIAALVGALALAGAGQAQDSAPVGPVPMAIGLAGISDWTTEQPFLDVMKTARMWIGHKPGRWGGASYEDLDAAGYLDANGWPVEKPPELASIGTLILTDQPEQALSLAGRYRLRFDGDGIVEVSGRATNVRYGRNEVQFDYAPGPGFVDIRIQRTDRARRGDHVRNITVVRTDHAPSFDAGAVFNPDWLALIDGFSALRFMDWMLTNITTQTRWQDRPRPEDFSYTLRGAPVEVMVELANLTGADPWFNMPHLADDDYLRAFAQLVHDRLDPERTAYVEFSNEVWNWQFAQTHWAGDQAVARWGTKDAWMQAYAVRASEMARIWSGVYGDDAAARLVNVISSQTGWLGLEGDAMEAPRWMAEPDAATHGQPYTYFDAYAVTGYFGHGLGDESRAGMIRDWIAQSGALAAAEADRRGLAGAARKAFVAAHRYDAATALAAQEARDGAISGDAGGSVADLLTRILPYHAEVARRYGLDLIMYEGGSHVVGLGPVVDDQELTDFFIHFNYSPEMGGLYSELIAGWHRLGGRLFNAYADVMGPSKWGSWGTRRHLGDDNPRWRALVSFR